MDTKNKVSAKKKALWRAINHFISRHGGSVISSREMWPIELVCPFSSSLPDQLSVLGCGVQSTGAITRVLPDGPSPMEAFRIDAPGEIQYVETVLYYQ